MCILLLFYKQIPSYPLALCANRDEFFDRPASPPLLWEAGEGCSSFLAPQDLRAKGTWIGLNSRLGIAAITNRKSRSFRGSAPSRGLLCAKVLGQGEANPMVVTAMETAGQQKYNGFNLLVADLKHAYLIRGKQGEVECRGLSPGIHVLTNEHELNEVALPGAQALKNPPASEEELLERMAGLLKGHEPLSPDGFAPCKHLKNRGTRSASILLMDEGKVRYLFANGPPCSSPFEDFSREARKLLGIPKAHPE